jgi:ligand-binding sensor domain-containing protein
MKFFFKYLLFYFVFCSVENLLSQIKQEQDKVYFQLNYKPGDWITISASRYSTSVAVGYKTAYIGTLGGILRYDFIKKQYDYPLTTSNGLLDNYVKVVAIDRQNDFLWAATKTGLQIYNPFSRQFNTTTYFQIGLSLDEEIHSIGFEINKVWLQTNKGYFSSTNSLFGFVRDNLSETATPVWYGLRAIPLGKMPHIFTNIETGFQFDDYEKVFIDNEFRKFPVSYYTFDHLGNLWITTYGAGVWKANSVSFLAEPLFYGLAMEDVSAMCFDDVSIWTGGNLRTPFVHAADSFVSGITVWNQERDEFKYYDSGFKSGLRLQYVNYMIKDHENIWIGTDEGLIRKIRSMDYWTTYGVHSGLYHSAVYSLAVDGMKLYIGTQQGLNIARPKDKDYVISKMEIPELFNTPIFKILISRNILWLGTGNGIYTWSLDKKELHHYNALGFNVGTNVFLDQQVRGIAEDSACIYLVSELSVIKYDKSHGIWTSIPVNTSYLSSGINDAACDENSLWIATNSGVLRHIKAKHKWLYYGLQDGLSGERVKQILIDGDYVWFGTNKGLTQFYWNAPHLME